MSPPRTYEKFTYWLGREEVDCLSDRLAERRIRLKTAKSVVCTPLDILTKIAVVPPEVWNDLCGRQGSWYRASPFAGRFLVVSSFPLHEWGYALNTRIRKSEFTLPRFPSEEELERLLASSTYREAEPPEWRRTDRRERRRWERWLAKAGIEITWERLFRIHCANHANFLEPVFFLRQGEAVVPYSIAPSAYLCSCCLELYHVIGTRFSRKLVSPCLGALTFARLEADRYLEVTAG